MLFCLYGFVLDVLSFPTRRSSDLVSEFLERVLERHRAGPAGCLRGAVAGRWPFGRRAPSPPRRSADRKSTRLNSSHVESSYAVFCLKKKTKTITSIILINLIRISL